MVVLVELRVAHAQAKKHTIPHLRRQRVVCRREGAGAGCSLFATVPFDAEVRRSRETGSWSGFVGDILAAVTTYETKTR
ncbi:hypothetical protein [Streptomyces nogalater]|uniref:Uncharacterized protein n=1 Tax=Streptomyces nogalater TaxID=38314 RepID=A0ABW0WPX3_STRNO